MDAGPRYSHTKGDNGGAVDDQGSARERNFLGRGVYHDPCDTDANTVVRSGVKPEPVACLVAVITVSHEGDKMVSRWHEWGVNETTSIGG